MVGIQIGMAVMCGVYASYSVPELAKARNFLFGVSIVNGCVD